MASPIAVSAATASPASTASAYSRWMSSETRSARAEASSSCWAATSHLPCDEPTPVSDAPPESGLHRPDALLGHQVQDPPQAADGQHAGDGVGPVDDPETGPVVLGALLVADEQVQRGAVDERHPAQVHDD